MKKKYKILLLSLVFMFTALFLCQVDKANKDNDIISGIYDRKFKDYVVFYPQHQDDEVLWGGSAIVEAIRQRGSDHVFVVLVSDGSGVNVFKDKQYKGLSRAEKSELRDNEFKAALKDMGISEENTIILSKIDDNEGTHFEKMKEVALKFERKYKNVTHIAHSYRYDNHPMHRRNGKVIQKLYMNNEIKDAIYFIKPDYANKVEKEKRVIYISKNSEDYKKIKDACLEYKLINKAANRYGIGYTSAHTYFDYLLRDKHLTSILHLPLKK